MKKSERLYKGKCKICGYEKEVIAKRKINIKTSKCPSCDYPIPIFWKVKAV